MSHFAPAVRTADLEQPLFMALVILFDLEDTHDFGAPH